MRKQFICFAVILVVCGIFFIYAGQHTDTDISYDVGFITKEEALQDYDEMWQLLYDNYPFLNIGEKKYNISVSQIQKQYREKLEEMDSTIDILNFYGLLCESVADFKQLGHLSVLSPQRYELNINSYEIVNESYPELTSKYNQLLYSRLTNEKSALIYDYMGQRESVGMSPQSQTRTKTVEVETAILDADTAYIKIDTFRLSENYANEGNKLLDFYKEIEGKQTNLIIDVTQNGGGSDTFWMEYIIFPNISSAVENEWFCLAKGGDEVKAFIETSQINLIDKNQLDLTLIDADDRNELEFCYKGHNMITPANGEKMYSGKIYVLADSNDYSSTDSFVAMCRASGFATIVGNYTGGNGLSASPTFIPLKNSGLILQFSFQYALNDDYTCNTYNGTKPDYFCKQGGELEKCLQLIENSK